VVLKGLKIPSQAISECNTLQNEAEKLLADDKNAELYDEIFPIFKNNSMVFSVAIFEFVKKWNDTIDKNSITQKHNKEKRRLEIIAVMKKVRKLGWLSEEVRGYNLD
jgi:hypothetical protein